MTKNTPRPASSVSPMRWAPPGPAPSIASGNSARSAAPNSAPVAKLTKCGRMRALRSSGTHRNSTANAALAMPPNAANSMILSSSGTMAVSRLEPDERRHAATLPVAAIGKKARLVGVGAGTGAEHDGNPQLLKTPAGKCCQIAQPAAARTGRERAAGPAVLREESAVYLLTNFEVKRSDTRPKP